MRSKNKQTVPTGTVFRAQHTGCFMGSDEINRSVVKLPQQPAKGQVPKAESCLQCSVPKNTRTS